MKLPEEDSGGLLIRDEIVFQGGARTPPADAVDLVRGYLRSVERRPQVRLRTTRRGILIHEPNRQLVADVVDDAVTVLPGQRVAGRFRELEVETTDATPPGLLKAVIRRPRSAGAGVPDPTPKYLRSIGGPDAAPAEVALSKLGASASLGDVVTHAIATGSCGSSATIRWSGSTPTRRAYTKRGSRPGACVPICAPSGAHWIPIGSPGFAPSLAGSAANSDRHETPTYCWTASPQAPPNYQTPALPAPAA